MSPDRVLAQSLWPTTKGIPPCLYVFCFLLFLCPYQSLICSYVALSYPWHPFRHHAFLWNANTSLVTSRRYGKTDVCGYAQCENIYIYIWDLFNMGSMYNRKYIIHITPNPYPQTPTHTTFLESYFERPSGIICFRKKTNTQREIWDFLWTDVIPNTEPYFERLSFDFSGPGR